MNNSIPETHPLAISVVEAIKNGDFAGLRQLLSENPNLAGVSIHGKENDATRSLLHVATDWPGHFPNVSETICLLITAGADVNAGIEGADTETPLHWAASSNDVTAIDVLLDGGANMDAQGAVIAGGDPLEDAIGFQNWDAAKRLVERGAKTGLGDEAAIGLMDKIEKRFEDVPLPSRDNIVYSFWNACCAGQLEPAKFLLGKGADVNWIPDWCDTSPLDGAIKSENKELVEWLKAHGAIRNEK